MTRTAERTLIVALAAGLVCMLATVVVSWLKAPAPQPVAVAEQEMMASSGSSAMPRAGMLMQQLQANPNDVGLLLQVSEELVRQGNMDAANEFLNRAILQDVNNPQVLYLQGYVKASKGDFAGGAELMEKSLAVQEDAAVRFSLGVIFNYYLKQPEKALAHWTKALEGKGLTEQQRADVQAELNKLKNNAK